MASGGSEVQQMWWESQAVQVALSYPPPSRKDLWKWTTCEAFSTLVSAGRKERWHLNEFFDKIPSEVDLCQKQSNALSFFDTYRWVHDHQSRGALAWRTEGTLGPASSVEPRHLVEVCSKPAKVEDSIQGQCSYIYSIEYSSVFFDAASFAARFRKILKCLGRCCRKGSQRGEVCQSCQLLSILQREDPMSGTFGCMELLECCCVRVLCCSLEVDVFWFNFFRVITVGQGCSKWGVRYDRIPHVTCMQWWYEEFYILILPYNFWMRKTFYTLTNRTLIRHILLPNGFFCIWGWRAPQTWENSFPGWHWLCRGLNERDQEQINYMNI